MKSNLSHFETLPMPACSIAGCQYPCQHFRTEAADPSSGVNENHAHGEAGRASQSDPSENHIGLDSSRLNPAGRSDHLTEGRC